MIINNPSDNKTSFSNGEAMDKTEVSALLKKKYKGDMTSKEAGNMVKSMIQEQERVLMEKHDKNKYFLS